ncbi:hypothetical protein MAP00_006811 [Monascus purpureus]|nr:hypothetical protein MAP00_006811 [Monascus purpureus]
MQTLEHIQKYQSALDSTHSPISVGPRRIFYLDLKYTRHEIVVAFLDLIPENRQEGVGQLTGGIDEMNQVL